MSYCRFSSDNFYCDVYVYQSCDRFVIHVAGRRQPPGAPPDPFDFVASNVFDADVFVEAHAKRKVWSNKNPLVDIDHPEAGASFHHATARECAENLIRLRGEGFVVPQYAIDELLAEEDEA